MRVTTTPLRAAAILAGLISTGTVAQTVPDAFEITRRFADAGMSQIALARVDALQPAQPSAPRWDDWEQLRCTLLARLERLEALAQRVAALPEAAPDTLVRLCVGEAARAAIAAAQGTNARAMLARLIWRQELPAEELRRVRLLVIESYLAEGKPEEAFMLMLRFQQDYQPVEPAIAARFVEGLLAAGMGKEAINWLAQLDDANPLKLMLRLEMSLIAPEAALAQARGALAKPGASFTYWSVVQRVATLTRNRLLQVEALENLLQRAEEQARERSRTIAAELWESYTAAAQDLGNRNQLLVGDDANWIDFAGRRGGTNAPLARAIFAYLVQHARAGSTRQGAQLQFVYSLQSDRLDATAISLFSNALRFPVGELDPQARYLLGSMAARRNQPAAAARFWLGLKTPPSLTTDEWNLQLAQVLVRAGEVEPGVAALKAVIAGKRELPADVLRRVRATARELNDAGHGKVAGDLYLALVPLAEPQVQRELLVALGRIAEASGDFQRAAEHFLEAAMRFDARAADALAIDARFAAAVNLARAGLRADARVQLNWLQQNVKDPEQQELIRRELAR